MHVPVGLGRDIFKKCPLLHCVDTMRWNNKSTDQSDVCCRKAGAVWLEKDGYTRIDEIAFHVFLS
jgi:hypothetical protein